MSEFIIDFLREQNIEYAENIKVSTISTVKIGGMARVIVYPKTEAELIGVLRYSTREGIAHRVIGGASNVLFCDGEINTLLICTRRLRNIKLTDGFAYSDCGVTLAALFRSAMAEGLCGFEELLGIPGTVGGAVFGNAGAFGKSISDLAVSARVYDASTDTVFELTKSECDFAYRRSRFQKSRETVLSVKFKFCNNKCGCASERAEKFQILRAEGQPVGVPSLGCTFKKAEGYSAGELIDKCGLKGHRIGGAQISEKHAGFIVNVGGATAKDYMALCYLSKKCVFERFHIMLEPEIRFITY